jgi:DNA-directed RNA polymerase subunit N (RpoN/RPB10)
LHRGTYKTQSISIMIIPVRCKTCGKVLADKWDAYNARVAAKASTDAMDTSTDEDGKTIKGKVMDELGITKMCCRIEMLSVCYLLPNI